MKNLKFLEGNIYPSESKQQETFEQICNNNPFLAIDSNSITDNNSESEKAKQKGYNFFFNFKRKCLEVGGIMVIK